MIYTYILAYINTIYGYIVYNYTYMYRYHTLIHSFKYLYSAPSRGLYCQGALPVEPQIKKKDFNDFY